MKPVRWSHVFHIWGSVILAIILFAIMAGIPYSLRC